MPQHSAVLSEGSVYLAGMAESPHAREIEDVGAVY